MAKELEPTQKEKINNKDTIVEVCFPARFAKVLIREQSVQGMEQILW